MTGYQPIVIPFNYPGIFGVGDRNRTCIKRICNPEPNRSAAHPHNLVEDDGIEPLGATLLVMPTGLQPATGNTLHNTLFRMCVLKHTRGLCSSFRQTSVL